MSNIGIIGRGFVGNAIFNGFSSHYKVRVYDIDVSKSTHSFEETISSDFVFVCLPTPMVNAEGGEADLTYIRSFFNNLSKFKTLNVESDNIFIIKSTVPVGTTKDIIKQTGIKNIVHSPEFLTANNSIEDFKNPYRNIIGGENIDYVNRLKSLYESRFPEVPCLIMSSDESEMVKYVANCFLATKVIFFTEMRLLSDKLNLNWDNLIKGVLADKRIGKSHYKVPGDDGERGFGGVCFSKDINALIKTFEKNNIDPLLLKSGWEQNKKVRKNWDWVNNPSAVSKKK